MRRYIGLDIGGTKCAVVLGREAENAAPDAPGLEVLQKVRFGTSGRGPEEILAQFAAEIDQLVPDAGFDGIGISCGGPLDPKTGIIQGPPNLPGWEHVEIVRYFWERYHKPVHLCNDADACAVAEWKHGAGRGLRNLVFLTFGTGMGAGLILDGRLYSGTTGTAGEVGHWRVSDDGPEAYGKRGSFEAFCSGTGIARAARLRAQTEADAACLLQEAGGIEGIDARLVADLADRGDAFCRSVYADSGRMLGKGLALMIDLLNPQMIVIGSIFARSEALLWPYAEEVIERECLSKNARACRVTPPKLGEQIGDMAALTVAGGGF